MIRVIETTVSEVSVELRRIGLQPDQRVTITLDPAPDLLDRARAECRILVAAAALTDADIDAMIDQARSEIPVTLTADEVAAISEAEAQLARGKRVPDQVMQEFWNRHIGRNEDVP